MLINFKEHKKNHVIIAKLRELESVCEEKFSIEEFVVFGIIANGTDTESSYVDIAILKSDSIDAYRILMLKIISQKY